ncbi:MAG: QueG-associated DUF1730 domain-containing protein, partial [Anaerolineales bacterium]
MTLTDTIKREALGLGFDVVGIARVPAAPDFPAVARSKFEVRSTEDLPESGTSPPLPQTSNLEPPTPLPHLLRLRLLEWLRRGYQGTMAWMERDPARRADPRRVLPACRSVISLGMNYYTNQQADERPGHGRIARYA